MNIYINNLLPLLIGERAVFLYNWSSLLVAPSAPAAPHLAHTPGPVPLPPSRGCSPRGQAPRALWVPQVPHTYRPRLSPCCWPHCRLLAPRAARLGWQGQNFLLLEEDVQLLSVNKPDVCCCRAEHLLTSSDRKF